MRELRFTLLYQAICKFIYFLSQSCLYCHSNISGELVCPDCYENILKPHIRGQKQNIYQHSHYYLFSWSNKNNVLEKLIYSLKQGFHQKMVSHLAHELIQHRMSQSALPFPIMLICAPSADLKKIDHSALLAKELSHQLQASVYRGLLKQESQKFKNKTERAQVQIFQTLELKFDPQCTYIFVDDVVTTGSTAIHSWKRLGRPAKFEIWSYAYRL